MPPSTAWVRGSCNDLHRLRTSVVPVMDPTDSNRDQQLDARKRPRPSGAVWSTVPETLGGEVGVGAPPPCAGGGGGAGWEKTRRTTLAG